MAISKLGILMIMETPRARIEEGPVDDDEIAALRGDIQRLQEYLREESRESQD